VKKSRRLRLGKGKERRCERGNGKKENQGLLSSYAVVQTRKAAFLGAGGLKGLRSVTRVEIPGSELPLQGDNKELKTGA